MSEYSINKRVKSALLLTSALALVAPVAAVAQDDEFVLEEIVVTAQKRSQSLGDVPVSVSALTGTMISDRGIQDVHDLATNVPALQVITNSGAMNTSFKIRGIGNDPNIPNFEPAVGLFVDGVYMPRSGLGLGDLVDIERIEILKGPQSTLYGKNVTGGVIHVITKKPGQEFEGRVEASYSRLEGAKNADAIRLVGSLSGPLSEKVSAGVSGVYYDQEGTYWNPTTSERHNEMKRYAVRMKMNIEFAEDSSLYVVGSRSKMPNVRNGDPDFNQGVTPAFLQGAFGVPCENNDAFDRVICLNDATSQTMTSDTISATLELPLGDVSFTSQTSYNEYDYVRDTKDVDQTNLLLAQMRDTQKGDVFSQEIRFTSPSGEKFEWLAGGYYQEKNFERGDRGQTPTFTLLPQIIALPLTTVDFAPGVSITYPMGTAGDMGFLDSRTSSKYYAAFAQIGYEFSEKLKFSAGIRYGHNEVETSIDNSSVTTDLVDETPILGMNLPAINLIGNVLNPVGANSQQDYSNNRWTWNAALQYYAGESTMMYLNYARGAKDGSFNSGFGNTAPDARFFRDEVVDHYEWGVKTKLFDGRMSLDAAVFYDDFKDFQNAGFVSLQFLVNNAESVKSQGIDIESRFVIAEGLTANFAVLYVDASYGDYDNAACPTGQAPNNATATACVADGMSLPMVPMKWKTSLGLSYEKELEMGTLVSRVDWAWQDDYQTNSNLTASHLQEAYSLVNASVALRRENVEFSLWVKNMFDKTYNIQTGVSNLFGADPAYQTFLGKPREIGAVIKYYF